MIVYDLLTLYLLWSLNNTFITMVISEDFNRMETEILNIVTPLNEYSNLINSQESLQRLRRSPQLNIVAASMPRLISQYPNEFYPKSNFYYEYLPKQSFIQPRANLDDSKNSQNWNDPWPKDNSESQVGETFKYINVPQPPDRLNEAKTKLNYIPTPNTKEPLQEFKDNKLNISDIQKNFLNVLPQNDQTQMKLSLTKYKSVQSDFKKNQNSSDKSDKHSFKINLSEEPTEARMKFIESQILSNKSSVKVTELDLQTNITLKNNKTNPELDEICSKHLLKLDSNQNLDQLQKNKLKSQCLNKIFRLESLPKKDLMDPKKNNTVLSSNKPQNEVETTSNSTHPNKSKHPSKKHKENNSENLFDIDSWLDYFF